MSDSSTLDGVKWLLRAFKITPEHFAGLRTALAMFGPRGWTYAVVGGAGTLFVIGAVTALFDNPVFGRQVAPRPQDYVFWVITAVLAGLIFGTYALRAPATEQAKTSAGGALAALAVGCPTCNKIAVTLLGTSGALNIFGPTQLFLGIASVALLAWTLLLRSRAITTSCALPEGGAAGLTSQAPSA